MQSAIQRKIFIHAANVHQGGGRTLLTALLKSLRSDLEYVLLLDDRMPLPNDMAGNFLIKRIKATVLHRFVAERTLVKAVNQGDVVLCFGNLPPLFKLLGRTIVFVQNRYLIDSIKLNQLPFKTRLRLLIERFWFSSKMANVSEFVVQTPTMKRLLELKIRRSVPVRILPFIAEPRIVADGAQQSFVGVESNYDFVYVSSGEAHKNHLILLEAWRVLATQGIRPKLALTLGERDRVLIQAIDSLRAECGVEVSNLGQLYHEKVLDIYLQSSALIFPSLLESFGLPLIEAQQLGLPILAPELDYVRDVCEPVQTFDPNSAVSIARAVKRFLGQPDLMVELHSPAEFWHNLL